MNQTMVEERHYDFRAMLERHRLVVVPRSLRTLWLNLTRRCNQTCTHCHVAASPTRTEQMSREVLDRCLSLLARHESCTCLDVTGGAPELHPDFSYLVTQARELGKQVIVRHNLTITLDGDPGTGEGMLWLPEFFARHRVELLASLPHYTPRLTDRVRGEGVFQKSLASLRRLNAVGYGREEGLTLNLVYNADGPLSPAERTSLEGEYHRELERYGVVFNRLYTVTNMPINRYRARLEESGTYGAYLGRLVAAFQPEAAGSLVCRDLISVGYDGRIYDCDFNQMLGLAVRDPEPLDVFHLDWESLLRRHIRFGPHCFGCTAGGGSS